jgi:hypothetical protein
VIVRLAVAGIQRDLKHIGPAGLLYVFDQDADAKNLP